MSLFSRRPIFGYDHETIGAQPMHEFVLLVPFLLPGRDRRWQSGVDHYFDQFPPCVWPRQKFAKFQPIQTTARGSNRTPNVRFIHEDQHSRVLVAFGILFSSLHLFASFEYFSLSQAITARRNLFAKLASFFASASVTCPIMS